MRLRKQKSRRDQVTDLAIDYLKLKAATKAAKGAGKAAKGTAVYKVATKTPIVKRIPVVIGAGVAALVAVQGVKRRGEAPPAACLPPNIPAPAAPEARAGGAAPPEGAPGSGASAGPPES